MSEAESPTRRPTVEDVRQLMGASTPHFALQLRNRIAKLIAPLPQGDPARIEGAREIARLELLGVQGETRGQGHQPGERRLPSLAIEESGAPPAQRRPAA